MLCPRSKCACAFGGNLFHDAVDLIGFIRLARFPCLIALYVETFHSRLPEVFGGAAQKKAADNGIPSAEPPQQNESGRNVPVIEQTVFVPQLKSGE